MKRERDSGAGMMRRLAIGWAMSIAVLVFAVTGRVPCASAQDQAGSEQRPAHEVQNRPVLPSGGGAVNHFGEICLGMSLQQVTDLIGPPTDTKQYVTGKSFIPFYNGTDGVRLEAVYRGLGRITFSGRPLQVYRIVTDAAVSGFDE
jgi:hypothetical protein